MANGCRVDKPGHSFEPSGWCRHNCGRRDDGRLMIHGDEKVPGPEYSPEQLQQIHRQTQQQQRATYPR